MKQLLDELTKREAILKRKPGKKKVEKQIRLLQEQIRTLESQEVLWTLKKLQQKLFDGSNKVGKYLMYQLKKKKEKRIIRKIMVEEKEINEDQKIKAAFLKFYSNLYKEKEINQKKLEKYLQKIECKGITERDKDSLDTPITMEGI